MFKNILKKTINNEHEQEFDNEQLVSMINRLMDERDILWRENEYLKANKILHVERPWSVILDQSTWTLVTLSETQNRAKRLLFFNMKNIPVSLLTNNSVRSQSQISISTSSSMITGVALTGSSTPPICAAALRWTRFPIWAQLPTSAWESTIVPSST